MKTQHIKNEFEEIGRGLYQLKYATNVNRLVKIIEEFELHKNGNYTEYLKLISEFLDNKDYILLADLLLFEIVPKLSVDEY